MGKESPGEYEIQELLLAVGISPNNIGFRYIAHSLQLIMSNEAYLHHVTKLLYIDVAGKFNTSSGNVEKNIRHSIAKAWTHNGKGFREMLFLNCLKENKSIPSNSQFLARLYFYLTSNNNNKSA